MPTIHGVMVRRYPPTPNANPEMVPFCAATEGRQPTGFGAAGRHSDQGQPGGRCPFGPGQAPGRGLVVVVTGGWVVVTGGCVVELVGCVVVGAASGSTPPWSSNSCRKPPGSPHASDRRSILCVRCLAAEDRHPSQRHHRDEHHQQRIFDERRPSVRSAQVEVTESSRTDRCCDAPTPRRSTRR